MIRLVAVSAFIWHAVKLTDYLCAKYRSGKVNPHFPYLLHLGIQVPNENYEDSFCLPFYSLVVLHYKSSKSVYDLVLK